MPAAAALAWSLRDWPLTLAAPTATPCATPRPLPPAGTACIDADCSNVRSQFWRVVLFALYAKSAVESHKDGTHPFMAFLDKLKEFLPGVSGRAQGRVAHASALSREGGLGYGMHGIPEAAASRPSAPCLTPRTPPNNAPTGQPEAV